MFEDWMKKNLSSDHELKKWYPAEGAA